MSSDLTIRDRKSLRPDEITEPAELIFAKLDEEVQKLALESRTAVARKGLFDLMTYYSTGKLLLRIEAMTHLGEAQKEEQLRLLTAYWTELGYVCRLATAYDMKAVARAFTSEFLENQYNEPLANGGRLSFKHFVLLQRIDESKQLAWLKRVRSESISGNQLEHELRALKQIQHERHGGRKPVVPRSPQAVIERTRSLMNTVVNFLSESNDVLRGPCLELPPDDIDQFYVELVEKTLHLAEDLVGSLASTRDDLSRVLERSQAVLHQLEAPAKESEPAVEVVDDKAKKRGRPKKAAAE